MSAKSSVTTHILDLGSGQPAAGVAVSLYRVQGQYHSLGMDAFFPEVCLEFRVNDPEAHYHVPLLLNQWGYSTYRGS